MPTQSAISNLRFNTQVFWSACQILLTFTNLETPQLHGFPVSSIKIDMEHPGQWPDEHTLGTYPNDPKFSKRLGFFQKLQKMAVWGYTALECHLPTRVSPSELLYIFGGWFSWGLTTHHHWISVAWSISKFDHISPSSPISWNDRHSGNQWSFKKNKLPVGVVCWSMS